MNDLRTALSNLVKNCVLPTAGNEQFQQAVDDACAALAQPEQEPYPLPESLYPDSKDWVASDYAGRVEWLHFVYESKTREVERLETTRLRAALAQPERKPLSDDEIKCIKPICADFVSFRAGVRHAEREHGIGGEHD